MTFQIVKDNKKEIYNVSVIVPVYNVEEYIRETLDSLLNQTINNLEIILIDDGSSDKSTEIIEEFLNDNENIVFVRQNNSGPGQARNVGIQLAKGAYCSFVDSDDVLPLDALQSMYTAAIKEDAEVVTGASLSFNSKKTWYIASHLNNGVYTPGSKSLVRNPELLYSVGPCNKLFKTELIKDISFPTNIKVTEDHPFVIEAYLKANKIFTVDKVIYNYRRRENEDKISLSQSVTVNSLEVLRDIMRSMELTDELWAKYIFNYKAREITKAYYYNRIVSADIWPSLNNALRNGDGVTQFKSFQIVFQWLKKLDSQTFNKIPSLHRVFTYEIALRFTLLDKKVYKLYLKIISLSFGLMNPGSLHLLEISRFGKEVRAVLKANKKQSVGPLKVYVFKHRLKKGFSSSKKLLKNGLVRRILYPIFRTLPVKKKLIFASNKLTRLGDSFEYIYNELRTQRKDYEIKGYFRKKRNFIEFCKYYYDLATAKYIILDDYYRPFYNLTFRKETEIIQLWHAAGAFKKFGYSSIGSEDSNTIDFEKKAHDFYTKVIVTGSEIIPHYADAFNISKENVLPLGLPRTDLFFDKDHIEFIKEKYLGAYPELRNKKIITYAPTFRGGPKDRAAFTLQLDLETLEKKLSDKYVLVLKLHPSVTKQVKIPAHLKSFVINLSKNDMNNVLTVTDILISDYSSLIFEFALLNRPMIFFAYDLEQYISQRGFYYDYESFVPGPIVKTTAEIIEYIEGESIDIERLEQFKRKFFDHHDGHSAKRFVESLIEP